MTALRRPAACRPRLPVPARWRWTARRWRRRARPLLGTTSRGLARWARAHVRPLAALAIGAALLAALGPAVLVTAGFVLVCPWLSGWRRAWLAAVLATAALATLGPLRTAALATGTALAGWLALTHHRLPTSPPARTARPAAPTSPHGRDRDQMAPVIPLRPRPARHDPPPL